MAAGLENAGRIAFGAIAHGAHVDEHEAGIGAVARKRLRVVQHYVEMVALRAGRHQKRAAGMGLPGAHARLSL